MIKLKYQNLEIQKIIHRRRVIEINLEVVVGNYF